MTDFKFQFSLKILNHLGRGLYRNFATVIAEAVSNSWDAEATRVDIHVDKESKTMTIKDNGKGMDEYDFRERFLNVGYTRRTDKSNPSERKLLGRKGIGKLAMLSVSQKVTIHSKKQKSPEIGGVINNGTLDNKIESNKPYTLGPIGSDKVFKDCETGTYLKFESINDTMNRPEILRKYLAILFNFSFSFSNQEFDIYLNDKKISMNDLGVLYDNTELLWQINLKDSIKGRFNKLKSEKNLGKYDFSYEGVNYEIKGYVASVKKVSDIKLRGDGDNGEFKAGVHLFVNGRLRQENVLDDLGSDRITVRYLYGEIHVDDFDKGNKGNDPDIFTSNREGVFRDDPVYKEFLIALKRIQRRVINDWDQCRRKEKEKILEDINLDGLKPDKRDLIIKLRNADKYVLKIIKKAIPKPSDKKILICHSSKDKSLAYKVEQELLIRGFNPKDILYTSSKNVESRLPIGVDIFDYIQSFFIQDWRYNPVVIFIASPNMEESWHCSLEVGATWVTATDHYITTKNGYRPDPPLDIRKIYLAFDKNGEFKDPIDAKRLFNKIKLALNNRN